MDGSRFIKDNIYNLEIVKNDQLFNIYPVYLDWYKNNRKLNYKIYCPKYLAEVKDIRRYIFGPIEDDISTAIIIAKYDKCGLFWDPNNLYE
jgi:hypothetical protein